MAEIGWRARRAILIVGLIQGCLLLLAHVLIEGKAWPATDPAWLIPWYSIVLGVPLALHLLIDERPDRRLVWFVLGLAVVLTLLGVYADVSVNPGDRSSGIVVPYAVTVALGWYVFLPFVQTWLRSPGWSIPYPALYEHAWDNILTLVIAGVFIGIFWGLLALWAGLFAMIRIDFFAELFSSPYFLYPVSATIFSYAVCLGRAHTSAVITVRRIVLTIFRSLFPLLALISLLFLAVLPFIGLQPLWATRFATPLMLTLQIWMIIFLNAVFQDGTGGAPYNQWLRGGLRLAIILLPIYTGLCVYALGLRVQQHGWSVDRVWAALLVVITGLYVSGYLAAAVGRTRRWLGWLAPINVAMAAVVVALSVLVNSPLLDPRGIAARSQVGRLLSGAIGAADFDFAYLRFDLGRVGVRALERLRSLADHPEAEIIRERATATLAQANRWSTPKPQVESAEELATHVEVYPVGSDIDPDFREYLLGEGERELKRCLSLDRTCRILKVDLNGDQQEEYAFFSARDRSALVYGRRADRWARIGRLQGRRGVHAGKAPSLTEALQSSEYEVVEPVWRNLRIGGLEYEFQIE